MKILIKYLFLLFVLSSYCNAQAIKGGRIYYNGGLDKIKKIAPGDTVVVNIDTAYIFSRSQGKSIIDYISSTVDFNLESDTILLERFNQNIFALKRIHEELDAMTVNSISSFSVYLDSSKKILMTSIITIDTAKNALNRANVRLDDAIQKLDKANNLLGIKNTTILILAGVIAISLFGAGYILGSRNK